jgi:hypothetical protein
VISLLSGPVTSPFSSWICNDLSVLEEAGALFAASAAGASKARIRKATGLGRDSVTARAGARRRQPERTARSRVSG